MNTKSGQTLVALLVFMIMAITITGAAVTIMIQNSMAASTVELGNDALSVAENGVEDALLRVLRNPAFTGETLTTEDGNATVNVVGVNPKIITSQSTVNGFIRTVEVTIRESNDAWTVISWKELF